MTAVRPAPVSSTRLAGMRSQRAARTLLCVTIVLSVYIQLGLPLNVAPADLTLALLLLLGVRSLIQRDGGPFDPLFRRLLPAVWLLAIATVLGMTGFGVRSWALDHGTRDLMSVLTFVTLGAYLWSRRLLLSHAFVAFAGAGCLVSVSTLLAQGGLRVGGVFKNPNYAAHFLATAAAMVVFAPWRRSVKAPIVAFLLLGIVPTGSFGGVSVFAGVLVVLAFRQSERLGPQLAVILRIVLALAVGWMVLQAATAFEEGDYDLGSGASSQRFDRSSDTRFTLWGDALALLDDHPLGIGPRSYKLRDDIEKQHRGEVHNDYVSFAVEQGPLGLVAFLWILAMLWRFMPRLGAARALAFGFALSGVFREVVNFRHVWLALVVLAIADLEARRQAAERSRSSEVAPGVPV